MFERVERATAGMRVSTDSCPAVGVARASAFLAIETRKKKRSGIKDRVADRPDDHRSSF